jgi:dTMP kinase
MTNRKEQGLLIVFEGTDGTGKSTQLQLLENYLKKRGYPVISTREPTEGVYGQKIRKLYVNRSEYTHEEELELFLADRREHVDELLRPSLLAGIIVLCDRYFLSTAAYQGAIGFDPEQILQRNNFAPDPDIALLFQVSPETGVERITSGRGDTLNDFEQRESLEKVAAIFGSIKRPFIRKIDATGTIEEVHRLVIAQVTPLLPVLTPSDKN